MSKRKKQARKPARLSGQIERIVEPKKNASTTVLDSRDDDLSEYLQLLAQRIQKIGHLEPSDISTQEGALLALPMLQLKLAEITEVQHTVKQLRKLVRGS